MCIPVQDVAPPPPAAASFLPALAPRRGPSGGRSDDNRRGCSSRLLLLPVAAAAASNEADLDGEGVCCGDVGAAISEPPDRLRLILSEAAATLSLLFFFRSKLLLLVSRLSVESTEAVICTSLPVPLSHDAVAVGGGAAWALW